MAHRGLEAGHPLLPRRRPARLPHRPGARAQAREAGLDLRRHPHLPAHRPVRRRGGHPHADRLAVGAGRQLPSAGGADRPGVLARDRRREGRRHHAGRRAGRLRARSAGRLRPVRPRPRGRRDHDRHAVDAHRAAAPRRRHLARRPLRRGAVRGGFARGPPAGAERDVRAVGGVEPPHDLVAGGADLRAVLRGLRGVQAHRRHPRHRLERAAGRPGVEHRRHHELQRAQQEAAGARRSSTPSGSWRRPP